MSADASLWWEDGALSLLDQTVLPHEIRVRRCASWEDVADAIRTLQVRGAPAIGLAAAYGLALAAQQHGDLGPGGQRDRVREAAKALRGTRPTAVNLAWALDRLLRVIDASGPGALQDRLLAAANAMARADLETNRRIGRHGAGLLSPGASVLTYCNTGMLATGGYGTAFGVLRAAHERGLGIHVFACETRPVLQGARLTAWELLRGGIPSTLIADNAAGALMRAGEIAAVIVGADRIAANGDVANKVGTYTLAVLAHAHRIPFYVAAPTSTIDLDTPDGDAIPIEERDPGEVTTVGGVRVAPGGVAVRNPAFDVTPHRLVTAIITEAGVVRAPYAAGLRGAVAADTTAAGDGA
ncbi:MAG TPA: S-methyl-5-thioribose-1-phosphate isomerase [bacterium]|nr:S-methyl-5-thioribose-1-phosphate isomerase [bacterium]